LADKYLSDTRKEKRMPKWLKCTVANGMFSDECTIIVRTRNGEMVSVFVPKDLTQRTEGRVKVRVTESQGHSFALLPDEHQSIIDVDASDLLPA
jgi:hypothetical protein